MHESLFPIKLVRYDQPEYVLESDVQWIRIPYSFGWEFMDVQFHFFYENLIALILMNHDATVVYKQHLGYTKTVKYVAFNWI